MKQRAMSFLLKSPLDSLHFLLSSLGSSKNTKANGLASPVSKQEKPLFTGRKLCLAIVRVLFSQYAQMFLPRATLQRLTTTFHSDLS